MPEQNQAVKAKCEETTREWNSKKVKSRAERNRKMVSNSRSSRERRQEYNTEEGSPGALGHRE